MAEVTNISWCDATLSFWIGCTKVSIGEHGACQNCYAETWANRWPQYRDTWGPGAPRVQFKHLLAKAMKLERLAIAKLAAGGGAFFCFSNSLSDIFDNEVPIEWLSEAFDIMVATPHVTYLLLTKRPQNIMKRWLAVLRHRRARDGVGGLEPSDGQLLAHYQFPKNVALGCTTVTKAEYFRDVPWLLRAKQALKALFAFVSMEPLQEVFGISTFLKDDRGDGFVLDWVIVGFESGARARTPIVAAARRIRDECAEFGVPFQFKQWGAWHADAAAYTDMNSRNPPPNMKIGPKRSGRLLDGVIHDARPEIRKAA